jgi:hypothetical protein
MCEPVCKFCISLCVTIGSPAKTVQGAGATVATLHRSPLIRWFICTPLSGSLLSMSGVLRLLCQHPATTPPPTSRAGVTGSQRGKGGRCLKCPNVSCTTSVANDTAGPPETKWGPGVVAAAGDRVVATLTGWENTKVFHTLYLPDDYVTSAPAGGASSSTAACRALLKLFSLP